MPATATPASEMPDRFDGSPPCRIVFRSGSEAQIIDRHREIDLEELVRLLSQQDQCPTIEGYMVARHDLQQALCTRTLHAWHLSEIRHFFERTDDEDAADDRDWPIAAYTGRARHESP